MAAPGIDVFLAVVWHDPPWKPWGMMVNTPQGKAQIGGVSKPRTELAEHIASRLASLESKEDCKGVTRLFREVYRELAEIASRREAKSQKKVKSHEIQALVIPAVLYAVLSSCPSGGSGAELGDLAEVVKKAGELIAGNDWRLHCADTLASAVDRSLILYFDSTGRPATTSALSFVNPFNPKYNHSLSLGIDVSVIVDFVYYYVRALWNLAKNAKSDRDRVLRDASFLLLEPLWLAAVKARYGDEFYKYVPPADTRLPTHTVFDHVNAALAALLWCGSGNKPRGLLAEVDLAGVQSWISESRRLRDLWAASWLASLLTWKAVEVLVDEYGPGVLVQPPARLHPFLAAKLAGRLANPQIKLELPSSSGSIKLELTAILGLRLGWPVDPTIPSRALLALPEGLKREDLVRTVNEGIANTWSSILKKARSNLKLALKVIDGDTEKIAPRDLLDAMLDVEPPLAVRVNTVKVEEAYEAAKRALLTECFVRETRIRKRKAEDETAKALFLAFALRRLASRSIVVKVPGRRFGRSYYAFYKKALEVWGKRPLICTVCGKAPAVVDGEALENALSSVREGIEQEALVSDVLGERLCPYCLAKRMLRKSLTKGLAKDLVGIDVTRKARKVLEFATIDAFTSRTLLSRSDLEKIADDLENLLTNLLTQTDIYKLPSLLLRPALIGNRFSQKQGGFERSAAESIIIEVTHDDRVYNDALNALPGMLSSAEAERLREILKAARRATLSYRAKTAIVRMDADNMGKGILMGRLSREPRNYASDISRLQESQDREKFAGVYTSLTRVIDSLTAVKEESRAECPACPEEPLRAQTAVLSLSYLFSVSRALALQAVIDRDIVESLEGMLIYAGGDDLLAIVPPVAPAGEGKIEFPAIRVLARARRTFWGVNPWIEVPEGFNAITAKHDSEPVPIAYAPSLTAYGRSGVLYIFDADRPLWLALGHSMELEEAKDTAFKAPLQSDATCGNPSPPCKDVAVVYNDSTGGALLPLSLSTSEGPSSVARLLDAAASLASHTASEKKVRSLSPRIYYELLSEVMRLLWEAATRNPSLAKKIIENVIHRHKAAEEIDPTVIAQSTMLDASHVFSTVVGLREPLEALAVPRNCGCLGLGGLLAFQIVGAARALHGSK